MASQENNEKFGDVSFWGKRFRMDNKALKMYNAMQ